MNQKEELNNIMLQIQSYSRSHNGDITPRELYDSFQEYGISKSQKDEPISDNDKKQIWDMLNEKRDDKTCFFADQPVTEGWNFFITNLRYGGNPNYKWKVYIPIKYEHYGFVVKNVISFLADNGIISNCKFSGSMRSDSMIVCLENEDDVTKLNLFLDGHPSFKACLGTHNPFIPDFNGIGVAHTYDYDSSYTQRLSYYLAKYVNTRRSQRRFDLITAEDFLTTMKESLSAGMVRKPQEIEQLIEHMDVIMNGAQFKWDTEQKPYKK